MLTSSTGRTGRIGHRGLATSFFTERDDPIASVLTRTLLETNQVVPDFLSQYIPDGFASLSKGQDRPALKFEADSDFEDDADSGDNSVSGGGWGADEGGNDGGDGWGAAGKAPTGGGPDGWALSDSQEAAW